MYPFSSLSLSLFIMVRDNCVFSGFTPLWFSQSRPEAIEYIFPSLYCPRLQHKGHRLPFPTPWDANITFFRAGFWVRGLGPISFEFDLAIAIEILIHHEDSPSWKKMALCVETLFEVWIQNIVALHQPLKPPDKKKKKTKKSRAEKVRL